LIFLVFLLLWVLYFYFSSCYLFSFHTINFTIIIFSSLLLPPSLSLLLLCKNLLLSSPATCSMPLPPFSPCPHLPFPLSLNLSPEYPPSYHKHPATTIEIHPNTYKDHKTQQTLNCFPHSPTPLPAPSFSATLSNSPNFYS
jgi:hypothetical protein